MNWPADPVMLMCVAHAAGDVFTVRHHELHITVRSESRTVPAPPAALDELESRGWIEVLPRTGTALTERGTYWTRRWLEQRLGKGRMKKTEKLHVTGGAA